MVNVANSTSAYILRIPALFREYVSYCLIGCVAFQRYYLTLPFLLWSAKLPLAVKIAILPLIEWAFNVFPATPLSSGTLQACHWILLFGLYLSPMPIAYATDDVVEVSADEKKGK